MAAFKIAALQKSLDDSVSASELERANKQYTELTIKYRNLLQKDNHLVQKTNTLEHLEVRLLANYVKKWRSFFIFITAISFTFRGRMCLYMNALTPSIKSLRSARRSCTHWSRPGKTTARLVDVTAN